MCPTSQERGRHRNRDHDEAGRVFGHHHHYGQRQSGLRERERQSHAENVLEPHPHTLGQRDRGIGQDAGDDVGGQGCGEAGEPNDRPRGPATWTIGTNTKTATSVAVARCATSNAHRSGFSRRYNTSTAATPSACAATIVVGVEKTRPMTSGTSERESQRSLRALPTSSTNTSVTANPAASIHQGHWIRPSGAGIESAVHQQEPPKRSPRARPVRHQTRTAPLIRGRDDLRWASITGLFPPMQRFD